MDTLLNKIISRVREIYTKKQNLDLLHIFSSKDKEILLPQTNFTYIYIVLKGEIYLNDSCNCILCRSGEYFVSNMTTSLKGILSGNDFLSVSVEFLPDEIISVLLEMDKALLDKVFGKAPVGDYSLKILNSLNELLNVDCDNAFLFAHFKRELIFYLLMGKYGFDFIQNTLNLKNAGNIYKINSWIKENYKTSFSVEELAKQANMSISGFHRKFKSAVGMGPIQCQKKLRLIEARKLMLRNGLSVTEASLEVGYESLSQFNRDYRQVFGETPKKDINNIRNYLKAKDTG